MKWTPENLWRIANNVLYQTKPSKASEIRICFSWREPNKIVPIIYANPNNRTICEEIVIEEEE